MEGLRKIVIDHYQAGSPQVRALAHDFFKAMDTNGDGRVDRSEFLAFMRQQGYSQMCNPSFFIELDRDGNGTLDFFEVMTLYYIIKSGRPICVSCGTFFSCVESFKNHLALSGNQVGPTTFNGNIPVSRAVYSTYMNTTSYPTSWITNCPTYMNTSYLSYTHPTHPPSASPNFPNAIVPAASTMDKLMVALETFEMGLNIGNIADIMCTTM